MAPQRIQKLASNATSTPSVSKQLVSKQLPPTPRRSVECQSDSEMDLTGSSVGGVSLSQLTPPDSPNTVSATLPATSQQNSKFHAANLPDSPCSTVRSSPATGIDQHSTIFHRRTREAQPFSLELKLLSQIGQGGLSKILVATPTRVNEDGSVSPSRSELGPLVVKKPSSHRAAKEAVRHEAAVYAYMSGYPSSTVYTARFHGTHEPSGGLVLSAMSCSLLDLAQRQLEATTIDFDEQHDEEDLPLVYPMPTEDPTQPLPGVRNWLELALHLVRGLEFLHNEVRIIHGDIKPANILVSPINNFESVNAVFCDFSNARLIDSEDEDSSEDAISSKNAAQGITTAYVAPELLASFTASGICHSTAADVWALALTVLVAATGLEPYSDSTSEMQRLAMARSGIAWQMYTNSEQAARLSGGGLSSSASPAPPAPDADPSLKASYRNKITAMAAASVGSTGGKSGFIWRAVEGALKMDPAQRWSATQWIKVLEHLITEIDADHGSVS